MKRHAWLGTVPTDWVAALLMALCGFCLIVSVWLESGNGEATLNFATPGLEDIGPIVVFFLLPVFGGLMALRQPANPLGWLLSAGGALLALGLVAHTWAVRAVVVEQGDAPFGQLAAWTATWVLVPGFGLLVLVVARFPYGSVTAAWLARLERVAIAAIVVLAICQAFAPDRLDGVAASTPIPNPLGVDSMRPLIGVLSGGAVSVIVGFVCVAIVDLVRRVRAAPPTLREQLRWVALALAPLPLLIAAVALEIILGLDAVIVPTAYIGQAVIMIGVTIALAHAMFGTRIFARSRIVDRSLVLVLLSSALAVGYVALVAIVGTVASNNAGLTAAIAAGAGAALLLTPLRGALQRRVNKFVFGTSSDPFAVVDALVARLDAARDAPTAASAIVTAIASTTRVPYVAIELDSTPVAEHGVATEGVIRRFPIVRHGAALGDVVVSLPAGTIELSPRDQAVIDQILRHAGPALHAQKLAADVERSRAEVIVARETERRQLRRDLHDGIGPSLAGLGLQLDAVLDTLSDPTTSASLERINADLADTVAEVRRVAGGLRPPALDELGLFGALDERSCALNASFTYDTSSDSPTILPAAIEVAIYHIASEALTNVARHARATHCDVTLRIGSQHADLQICDDGIGLPTTHYTGVGLASMRARAEELGGTFAINNTDPGVCVRVGLPLDDHRQ